MDEKITLTEEELLAFKRKTVKENKDAAVTAINVFLDAMYSMTDKFLDEDGNLVEGLTPDEKVEKFVKELLNDEKRYEKVRQKVLADDIELSLSEINHVGLAFTYVNNRWKEQINTITKAIKESENIIKVLFKGLDTSAPFEDEGSQSID